MYAEPYVYDDIFDGEIVIDEIKYVLKKTKDIKAPGPDKIPNEFFK